MFNSAHEGWKWALVEAVIGLIAFVLMFVPLYRLVVRSIRGGRLWHTPTQYYDDEGEPIADARKHPLKLWEWSVFPMLAVWIGCWWQSIPLLQTMYYIERADNLSTRRDGVRAVALYHRALGIDPQSALAHRGLGQVLDVLGRQDEALHEYALACRDAPDNASVHRDYGRLLLATGSQGAAIGEYYRCVALDVQDYVSHNILGNALVRAGRPSEAIREYRLALQFDPVDPESRLNLASTLQLQGRFDEAIAEYKRVLLDRPDDPLVHNNMGRLLFSTGKTEEAIQEVNRAIEVAPKYPMPYYNLGKFMQQTGKREEATSAYKQFLEHAGKKPEYAVYTIDVHARLQLLRKPGMEFMHAQERSIHQTAVPLQ